MDKPLSKFLRRHPEKYENTESAFKIKIIENCEIQQNSLFKVKNV